MQDFFTVMRLTVTQLSEDSYTTEFSKRVRMYRIKMFAFNLHVLYFTSLWIGVGIHVDLGANL